MIQYIIAAGIGAFLGSQSKKSKKSYAHGGGVNDMMSKPENVDLGDDFTLIFNNDHDVDVEYSDGYRTLIVSYDRFINDGFDYEDDPPYVRYENIMEAEAYQDIVLDWEDAGQRKMAQGGQTTPPITNYHKNIMGTLSFDLKVKGMRKPQDFIVYPIREKTDTISIQSDKKFGEINILTGRGILSKSGSAMYHLSLDKARSNVNEFQLSKGEVQELKTQIKSTTGKSVGGSFVKSDNSAADLLAKGGEVKFRKLAKSKNFDIVTPDGRFEIEMGAFGMPKSIIIDGHRRDINRNPLAIKYRTEIQEYLDKN